MRGLCHHAAMAVRVTTWNLQGRERPDLAEVAGVLRELAPDVVLLQEVRRRQARALAAELGWQVAWRWKHWPVVIPAEGLAVLAPSMTAARSHPLAARWRFWSSRRRIAVQARVATPDRGLDVVDVHLGAGVGDDERVRQAGLVLGLGADVVAGDLNTSPGSTVLDGFAGAGFRDAWAEVFPGEAGPTNWHGPRTRPPTQRLDYVLVGSRWHVLSAEVPDPHPAVERFATLSDHLPVTVTREDRR